MNILLQLFLTFFKLGAFTFGGGYAMISLIENEMVEKKKWITHDDMVDIVTIAESTPGPLAINMATFVGTKMKGFLGALVATIGLVLPPFVIIIAITLLLNEFRDIALIGYALKGIQAGVVVLIFNAFLKFFKGMDKNIISYIFLVIAFFVALFTNFSVVLIILIGAVAGIIISLISMKIAGQKIKPNADTPNITNSDTSNMVSKVDTSVEIVDSIAKTTDDNEDNSSISNDAEANSSSLVDSQSSEPIDNISDNTEDNTLSSNAEADDISNKTDTASSTDDSNGGVE